jgi:uncharacterized protein YecE (DUF72 family)
MSALETEFPSHIGKIRCGIAGWSYPDWEGYVYPPHTKEKLRYIAEYVDVIEINSTFYRPPDARMVQSWVTKTSDIKGFCFTAKLHQDITHKGKMDKVMVEAFHRGFEPMIKADMLKHLLAQFKYDFADSQPTRNHLKSIVGNFDGMANLTLELRHNSWQQEEALEFLKGLGVSVANLDYPLAQNSFSLGLCDIGEDAYLRLHGRNYKAWFSKGAGRDETYNYLYSEAEVSKIAERATKLAKMSKSLTIIANNHYQGKEAVNILQIKAKLSGKKVPVPTPLVEKYPELTKIETVPDKSQVTTFR